MRKYVLFLLLLFIVLSANLGCADRLGISPSEKRNVETAAIENRPPSFGLSLNEFKTQYNEHCLNDGFSEALMIRNINVGMSNHVKTFDCYITGNTFVRGTISQVTGEIKTIQVSTNPVENEMMAVEALAVMTIVGITIAPELSPTERKNILEKLGVLDDTINKNGLELYTQYRDVGYAINSSRHNGLNFMFVALKK